MPTITSGATTDLWTIDPTSKAGRVTLYTPQGNPITQGGTGYYSADVRVRNTTAAAAPLVVWAIRNNSATKTVLIERIIFTSFFNGTGATSEQEWEWLKGTGNTAFGGGPTTVTAAIKRTAQGAPAGASIAVLDTGFTLTGVTLGAPIGSFYSPRITHSATQPAPFPTYIWDATSVQGHPIELVQNEVLAIRTVATSVIGDILTGTVDFSEV